MTTLPRGNLPTDPGRHPPERSQVHPGQRGRLCQRAAWRYHPPGRHATGRRLVGPV